MNNQAIYYVEFEEATDMVKVLEDLIMKYGYNPLGVPSIWHQSSAGNGHVLGATAYHHFDATGDVYEIQLNDAVERVMKSLFDVVFNALPDKEYCICLTKDVLVESNQTASFAKGYAKIGAWNIDIFTDADFNPRTLIRITGVGAVDAVAFNEHRPEIPGGTWYSEIAGGFDKGIPYKLTADQINALLRKYRFE